MKQVYGDSEQNLYSNVQILESQDQSESRHHPSVSAFVSNKASPLSGELRSKKTKDAHDLTIEPYANKSQRQSKYTDKVRV